MTVTQRAESAEPSRLIATEIRAEMARRGTSVVKLALALGVSRTWVTRRIGLSADVDMTFEDVVRMAEALGTNAERLISASGWLPRLDSNQQPSGSPKPQVIAPVTRLADVRRRKAER